MINDETIAEAKEKGFEKYFLQNDDEWIIKWRYYLDRKHDFPSETEEFLWFLQDKKILDVSAWGNWQVLARNIHFKNIDILNPNSGRGHRTPKNHHVFYYYFTSLEQAVHFAKHFKEHFVGRVTIQQVAKEVPLGWLPPECAWFAEALKEQKGITTGGSIRYL